MKHFSVILQKTEKTEKNTTKIIGESVTDDSQFRPDIASIRDKAISINQTGETRKGIYDASTDKPINQTLLKNLAYARGMNRDITEIESAKKYLEQYLEKLDEKTEKEEKEEIQKAINQELLERIAENTEKETVKSE